MNNYQNLIKNLEKLKLTQIRLELDEYIRKINESERIKSKKL